MISVTMYDMRFEIDFPMQIDGSDLYGVKTFPSSFPIKIASVALMD